MSLAQIIRRNEEFGVANPNRRFKTCTKCNQIKYRKLFSKSSGRRDGLNGWCKRCMKRISKKYLKAKAKQSREYRAALRLEVLQHYSNCKKPFCACCKINILEFLSIDHKKGGGTQHKKTIGAHLYEWLKKNKFPAGFRILCHNCNQSLGAYGYCPHNVDT